MSEHRQIDGGTAEKDFASIYQKFRPKTFRYFCGLSGEADAADLTQIVFTKVSQSLDSFRGESSLATWIYRIATNTAHDHAVSPSVKQRKSELLFKDTGSLNHLADSNSPGTEQEYIRRDMKACIRNFVKELPENYGTVLVLSELEGFTNPEIAEILGISVDAVKIRLHRARASLRKAVESRCNRDSRNELSCKDGLKTPRR